MKLFTAVVSCFLIVIASAQMGGGKAPAEMSKVAFLLGTWKGTETFAGMGGPPSTHDAVITITRKMKGRYLVGTHLMKEKSGTMEGMHVLTYDPAKKHYVAHWFDSEVAEAMQIVGNFSGKSLVMSTQAGSKEMYRATWTPTGASSLSFKLEGQQGGKWVTYITGSYKK